MARSNEPAFWSLFSAGGMVAAFLIPAAILITAYMVPQGKIEADNLREVMSHPIARLLLLAMISLPLFHWAHRFRFALVDLGIKKVQAPHRHPVLRHRRRLNHLRRLPAAAVEKTRGRYSPEQKNRRIVQNLMRN